MGFLNRAFRNRGLIENLSRDPVARIEPIAPLVNPIGSFPQISEQPIVPIRPLVSTPLQARRQELENLGYDAADVQEILERDQVRGLGNVTSNVLPSIPIAPPPVIPQIPQPLPQIPSPLPTPPPPINIGKPPLDTSLIPQREILERPIIPPRRDDFMSIERIDDPIRDIQPPVTKTSTLPEGVDEGGTYYTDSQGNQMYQPPMAKADPGSFVSQVMPTPINLATGKPNPNPFASLNESSEATLPTATPEPSTATPVLTPDQVIEPAPTTPAAVATDVGAVPTTTIPQDIRGQVDPVLAQQDTVEMQTDPLLRALYFGTADQPGFINQLQQATANLIGSDVPLQQTAGLSELEQLAQDRALSDLGVAEPFVGESADLIRGTTRQFDPSMTQQFFNPFEDQVVQQTIQDVLEAGEKRDVAQRARDIQTGGLSAFGSRARLTAADRQRALGRGLSEALGGIRQAGFGQAQRDALSTFAQQRQAEQQAARDIGQVGSTLADLRARERAGLVGFGQTGRGIEETGLSRLFQQQVDAQGRPLQALQLTGSLLPQFQAGSTRIDSQYRLPTDPSAAGLGAAFNAYAALAPKQGVG
jgi:hypothetical protein